jgi:glycosyltransferase involved in cell wall biosynthesis
MEATATPREAGISLCMIVKDEEQLLGKLLSHLRPWVDEMIVVDTGSADSTRNIARALGATVFTSSVDEGYCVARNVGIEEAACEWILWVDADEWPTVGLLRWLWVFAKHPSAAQYDTVLVWRENRIDGELIDYDGHEYEQHIRLFRSHLRVVGILHEQVFSENGFTAEAPRTLLLLHHKTGARQARQNAFYETYMREHGIEIKSG